MKYFSFQVAQESLPGALASLFMRQIDPSEPRIQNCTHQKIPGAIMAGLVPQIMQGNCAYFDMVSDGYISLFILNIASEEVMKFINRFARPVTLCGLSLTVIQLEFLTPKMRRKQKPKSKWLLTALMKLVTWYVFWPILFFAHTAKWFCYFSSRGQVNCLITFLALILMKRLPGLLIMVPSRPI